MKRTGCWLRSAHLLMLLRERWKAKEEEEVNLELLAEIKNDRSYKKMKRAIKNRQTLQMHMSKPAFRQNTRHINRQIYC